MNGEYRIGDIVLGNWTLNRLIGEGSYGRVYEASREDFGVTYKAAIKIITIPQNKSEVDSVLTEGMDEKSVTAYFRSMVEEIVREFALMSELKGMTNVVSYGDHAVIPHEGMIGWDIIIRMELLTPLLSYLKRNALPKRDVIKLGVDICRALELCQRYNIVHRDIKPENIFISKLGDFKLGDFGIARTVEKTTGGLSKKGTYTYMAPEVYKENAYGSSVDIYSLGLVLYRLLNDNRVPFLPQYPEPITFNAREGALAKRMAGEPLSPPRHAGKQLTEIILKACAYAPRDRYSSPTEMREDLERALCNRDEAQKPAPHFTCEELFVDSSKEQSKEEKTEGVFGGRFSQSVFSEKVETPGLTKDRETLLPRQEEGTVSAFHVPSVEEKTAADDANSAKKRKVLTRICLAIVATAIMIAVFMTAELKNNQNIGKEQDVTQRLIAVPGVQNWYAETAKAELEGRGFTVRIVEENNASVTKGFVVKQDVKANTKLPYGETIVLTVSGDSGTGKAYQANPNNAKDLIAVPGVQNWYAETAKAELERKGFTVRIVEENNASVTKGFVVKQDVKVNTKLPYGTTVVLTVSSGTGTTLE